MNNLITALNNTFLIAAASAERIEEMKQGHDKQSYEVAYLVDMMLNAQGYAELVEEYFNVCLRESEEKPLQLFFSTCDGRSAMDLCEMEYMLTTCLSKDTLSLIIENVEQTLKETKV